MDADDVTIPVDDGTVSGLWLRPRGATAALVIAHGAGAGMHQAFLGQLADGLAKRKLASLRYQFPYMEAGRSSPDSPSRAVATVRAAVAKAGELGNRLPLFAGGKSFGGRMTSTAAAEGDLPRVRGLFFLGFPLHPPGRAGIERGDHLRSLSVPMLFLQGTRDDFAALPLLRAVTDGLRKRAELTLFEGADHSFKVRKDSGTTDTEVREALLDALAAWVARVLAT